mmetsp:Transcript_3963/g.15332  ORF Transcript_3963/g.15332 Transcript_3963/m.15332 type:complete len:227 (-) Transcript_3963:15-695(-)
MKRRQRGAHVTHVRRRDRRPRLHARRRRQYRHAALLRDSSSSISILSSVPARLPVHHQRRTVPTLAHVYPHVRLRRRIRESPTEIFGQPAHSASEIAHIALEQRRRREQARARPRLKFPNLQLEAEILSSLRAVTHQMIAVRGEAEQDAREHLASVVDDALDRDRQPRWDRPEDLFGLGTRRGGEFATREPGLHRGRARAAFGADAIVGAFFSNHSSLMRCAVRWS